MMNINKAVDLFVSRMVRLKKFENLKAPECILADERKLIRQSLKDLHDLNFDVQAFLESKEYDIYVKDYLVEQDRVDQVCERCGSCKNKIGVWKNKERDIACKKNKFTPEGFYPDTCDAYESIGMDSMQRDAVCSNQCLECMFHGNGEDEFECLIHADDYALNCQPRKPKEIK